MALVTGQDIADAIDLAYPDPILDQVAEAASAIVAGMLTPAAVATEPAACKEAALAVAVDLFQARTAAGGQAVATDFSPGPYRLSVWLTKRVHSLVMPYANVRGMIG